MKDSIQNKSEQIEACLKEVSSSKRSSSADLLALFISVILFVSLGLSKYSLATVALLIVILLIHELGHFIGMKFLGYRDARMLFLPLMGAFTAGKEIEPSAVNRAFVAFLGPVPGILIGIVLWAFYFQAGDPILLTAARMFLFLNLFNLLPMHPFDGGRIIEALFFARIPVLEIGSKILGVVGLVWLTMLTKMWLLWILIYWVLASILKTFPLILVAQKLKNDFSGNPILVERNVPSVEFIQDSLVLLQSKRWFCDLKFNAQAEWIRDLWNRMRIQQPSLLMTSGLFVLYSGFLFIGMIALIFFEKMSL